MTIYKYKDVLEIILDECGHIANIKCDLPIIGEGTDRIVYDLGDNKVLKVARHMHGSVISYDEVMLYENLKNKNWFIRVPIVYEYEESYALWVVAEKIDMSNSVMAMKIALKYVPILDVAENAGFSFEGDLVIVDAENIGLDWFLKDTNPFYKKSLRTKGENDDFK